MCCSTQQIEGGKVKCDYCGYISSEEEFQKAHICGFELFSPIPFHCPKCCRCMDLMYEFYEEEDLF